MNIREIVELLNKCPDIVREKVMLQYGIDIPNIKVGDKVRIIGSDDGRGRTNGIINIAIGNEHIVTRVEVRSWSGSTSDDDIIVTIDKRHWGLSYELGHWEKI